MEKAACPDVVVYVCRNCVPNGWRAPRQWIRNGLHVITKEIPCTGKTDAQYMFHALEGGVKGLCVVACPRGDCRLAQGNYRAEIRVQTVRLLLEEIGLEAGRARLLHCSPNDAPGYLEGIINEAIAEIGALGSSPLKSSADQLNENINQLTKAAKTAIKQDAPSRPPHPLPNLP
ncbi:MAG: hydrogenase iron-sulfur subunit [Candidatus Sumerlaeota bacterium]|nr:hydrogenase iron-sulfur subunit [Candidatus Sumerlaeota bacterium]